MDQSSYTLAELSHILSHFDEMYDGLKAKRYSSLYDAMFMSAALAEAGLSYKMIVRPKRAKNPMCIYVCLLQESLEE